MPPRLSSLQPIVRHCRLASVAPQQTAQFSGRSDGGGSSGRSSALRDLPAFSLLDNDQPSNSGGGGFGSGGRSSVLNALYSAEVRESRVQQKTQAMLKRKMDQEQMATSANYTAHQPREFGQGEVYAPRDLKPGEIRKYKYSPAYGFDALEMLGINPLDEYQNFTMISEFMSPMGRILHSRFTNLRPVNQRRMAKAIRRAIGQGIHPSVHRHPHILEVPRTRHARFANEI